MARQECSVSACAKGVVARTWCSGHYQKWQRYGDPLGSYGRPATCRGCSIEYTAKTKGGGFCSRACGDRSRAALKRKELRNFPCAIAGCDRVSRVRHDAGPICFFHYQRIRLTGEPGTASPKWSKALPGAICEVDGCGRAFYAVGLCSMHHARKLRTGEVGPAGLLKKPKGSGSLDKNGYRYVVTPDGRRTAEHRYVLELALGRPMQPFENAHHKNGVRHDNRIENLELWTKPQPAGQRPEDLVAWVVANYPNLVAAELRAAAREKRSGQLRLVT